VTSHGQEQMVIESINAGAKGYVLKPVRADHLKVMIGRAMAHPPAPPPPTVAGAPLLG
jgi:two-component system chemotaxis response regulator CheY